MFTLTVKRSKFVGYAFSVTDEVSAREKLNAVKAEHRKAKHHVYAWRLSGDAETRFSDNGEPSGTAGRPILGILIHEDIKNVLVVVARYFGGTLLGKGGLVRAYTETAKGALNSRNQTAR